MCVTEHKKQNLKTLTRTFNVNFGGMLKIVLVLLTANYYSQLALAILEFYLLYLYSIYIKILMNIFSY